jgi:hypothetical protein
MANLHVVTSRKSVETENPLSSHISEWQRLSKDHKNQVLGERWYEDMEAFYALTDSGGPLPSFRPLIRTPELQTLMMREANDLTEVAPRPYIINTQSSKREEEREKVLQSEWRRSKINYHSMFAILSSMFTGMTPIQIGYDPDMRSGRGGTWAKMRDPRTFDCDPFTSYELDWSYVILEDYMHLDRVRKRWPKTSAGVKPRVAGRSVSPAIGDSGYGFQMPQGPMSMVPGLPNNRSIPNDNRVRVRWCFCEDSTRLKIEEKKLPEGAIVPADFEWRYPNNRLIVDCEGQILQDGDNPYPLKSFPIVPFWSTVPLHGIWAVPAVRYSRDIQNVSERLWTQLFENAIRINNGITLIDERTGIDPDAYGGMPGEVQVVNANTIDGVKILAPPPFPQQFSQYPQLLLDKQKELQGFTDARSGKPGAGNISPELFDESVIRSQGLTQLRGRLHAEAFYRIAWTQFHLIGKFMREQAVQYDGESGREIVKWPGLLSRHDIYDVELDDASLRPMSQMMIKRMVPELKKLGMMDTRTGLEHLDFPDAGGVADRIEREMELAALAKTKGNKK